MTSENVLFCSFAFLAGHILFLCLVLIFKLPRNNTSLLGLLLFLLLMRVGKSVLSLALPDSALYINIVGLACMAAMGPILWIYIKGLFRFSEAKLKTVVLSLMPAFAIFFVWSWPGLNLAYYGITVQLLIYLITVAYFLIRNGDTVKADNIRWKWAIGLLIGLSTTWLTFALQLFAYTRVFYLVIIILSIVLSYSLSLWAFTQQKLFTSQKSKKEADSEEFTITRSQIEQLMREEVFIDPALNLTLLAKRLNKPPYLVSRAINDQFNKTFPELLLHYRIKKAVELLVSSVNKTYTVEAIAYESGFSTLSAFYTAFKKETGTTPTQFRKQNERGNMKVA
jgi:AraC-like DNA-binding protein